MPSHYETFWTHNRFAVVGHSKEKPFPKRTYAGLKKLGKTVFPVDPSAEKIRGDPAYPDLAALPEPVDAVVLELPKRETSAWVTRAADAGIKELWIHAGTDTDEALSVASDRGMNVRHGTCAVMYVTSGFNFHSLHRLMRKAAGKY